MQHNKSNSSSSRKQPLYFSSIAYTWFFFKLFGNFFHLSLLWFFCCIGESENTPPPLLGLAANTLPPDPVTATAADDSYNGISENHSYHSVSFITVLITLNHPLILSFLTTGFLIISVRYSTLLPLKIWNKCLFFLLILSSWSNACLAFHHNRDIS